MGEVAFMASLKEFEDSKTELNSKSFSLDVCFRSPCAGLAGCWFNLFSEERFFIAYLL